MKKLLYVLSVLIVASLVLAACGPAPTPETVVVTKEVVVTQEVQVQVTPDTSNEGMTADGKVLIRWSIGLGTGTDPAQIPIEQSVVDDFNASQDKIKLVMEVIPNASSRDTVATEIGAGAGPDVVGPVGWVGSNSFYGQWLDIGPYLQADNYDSSKFEPALVKMYQSEDEGTVGLPFAVYPSAFYYNTQLFDEAGLNYPPASYGEKYVMPDGSEVEWNWDTVKQVAQMLTIDSSGKNSLDPAFDKNSVVQYGFTFQWESTPAYWGSFFKSGPDETFLTPGGSAGNYQARIPDAWMTAWQWYYDGIWGDQPYVPNGQIEGSADFNSGNSFASGKIGMADLPSWYLCCVGDLEKAGGTFDFAAMPVYSDGNVYGRVDADTFRIWKGTKHPQEAYEVLKYLIDVGIQKLVVGTPDTAPAYGAIPSDSSLRGPWLESSKAAHPSVQNWDVLIAGLNYPDVPSAEGYMPNMVEAWQRTSTFSNLLVTTGGLDLAKEADAFKNDLTTIFNK